jgi:predicted RNase H-like HicB family nuclease
MQYTVVLEVAEEGGYTARCLELPAAISEGDTKEEALSNIREAIELVLEVTREQAGMLGEIVKVDVASA